MTEAWTGKILASYSCYANISVNLWWRTLSSRATLQVLILFQAYSKGPFGIKSYMELNPKKQENKISMTLGRIWFCFSQSHPNNLALKFLSN